jgi:hypothetical protein
LKKNGYSQEEIDQVTIKNPQEAFAIRARMSEGQTPVNRLNIKMENELFSTYFHEGNLFIKSEIQEPEFSYKLLSISGQLIQSGAFHANVNQVYTTNLPQGTYLLNIVTLDGTALTKHVVKY